jgi:pyruvate dehydrogenase E1 component alpha subunit
MPVQLGGDMTDAKNALSVEGLTEAYRMMALIRRFEELTAKAYTLQKVKGFCHLSIGQEAVAVGATMCLEKDDTIVSAYREHGHILARGATPRAVMSELFGKSTGCTHGVGGSMHLSDKSLNFFGGFGIVGAHVPLATGAAFAAKYRGEDNVALTYIGDGAMQQGAVYEAMELATLWNLPCVLLIENNYYAMGTALDRYSFLTDLSKRGAGVGMKHWQFDGFDVQVVYDNVKRAVDHARSGKGPVIIEALTYRYRGHSMSDPAKYRKDGELEDAQSRDCLQKAEDDLAALGVDAAVCEKIRAEVNVIAQDAFDYADKSPVPDPATLYDYTYAG